MRTNKIHPALRLPHLADFKQGLFWNLFDSVGTQGLLILYHILFRNFFGTELHGKVGCSLSIFYLSIVVFNLGLDYSLAPFLEQFTKSKRSFALFITRLILPQLCFLILSAVVFFLFFDQLQNLFPLFTVLGTRASQPFLFSLSTIFVLESMKKTTKYFLQLNFYTPLTACVEVFGMLFYMLSILTRPHFGRPVTLEYTWQALCLLSLIQLLILSCAVLVFYTTLTPSHADSSDTRSFARRIVKTRFFSWSNQCLNQLFSGNFLVPLCALHFGLEQASLMKVITSISYWITYIANKVFGVTGNALLAHVKNRSLEVQQKAFEYISFLLIQALYFLIIFLTINGKKIALLQTRSSGHIEWSLLYFMLIISFFESLFIIYEKWYILEERVGTFFLFNLVSFGLLYALYPHTTSTITMLTLIIVLRLVTFLIMTLVSFYRWRIWPPLLPDVRALAGSLILSIAFFFLF